MKKLFFAILLLFCLFNMVAAEALEIPTDVVAIYVFLQKAGNLERGSSEEIGTALTQVKFIENFQRYLSAAKQRQSKLIVTAETSDSRWVQNNIIYKGKKLITAKYRNPGLDGIFSGAEIPTD